MSIPITNGSGQSSVAAEAVAGLQYQQIEVYGGGGSSILGINPDRSINASIIGVPNVNVSGSVVTFGTIGASVIGIVPVQLSNASIITVVQGSVAVTVTPAANQSVSGTVQTDVRGSVAVAIISGSIAATFTPPANQSVSGTVGSSIIGTVPVTQVTDPWTVKSSLAGGIFHISGSVAATITNTNLNVSGSVVAFLGTSPWPVVNVGSIISTQVGSVITVFQAPSVVGTYTEDAAFTQSDKGLFVLAVRNDNMASVTSADLDYSQIAVGPVGENIVANSPITKWVQGTADFRNGNAGASIITIASGGTSVFTYVTGVQVANLGSASVLVTLASGGSILGYTIAPAGGGSNIYYPNGLKTPGGFGFAASTSGIASVLVSAQGFTSRT